MKKTNKFKKLHLGNGTVYLDGWINIDMIGPLATDRPDRVKHNIKTNKNFNKYPFQICLQK